MIAGARRRLREPGQSGSAREGPCREPGLRLRLCLANGRLGLELAAPVPVGPLRLSELAITLDDLRFPLDLSGGVPRFRNRRGKLSSGRLEVSPSELGRSIEPLLRGQLGPGAPVQATLSIAAPDVIRAGLVADDAALAFDVVLAPLEGDLRLLVEDARGIGLAEPPHVAAMRTLGLLLRGSAERVGGAFVVRDLFGRLARYVLPDAGARAPASAGVVVECAPGDERGRPEGRSVVLAARSGGVAAALSPRAVRALEAAEIAAEGDDAAMAGDRERARRAYLRALERAPRHAEIAARLAALDAWAEGRADAALATIVEVIAPVDAGLLGSAVLEAVGDRPAAYVAAARAAATEWFGPLAGLAWLRAAHLAADVPSRAEALDHALARSPALAAARWARFEARLAAGDLARALGDAAHAEAAAPTPEDKHDACRRAAEALLGRGFVSEAQARFERALRHRPRSAGALFGLACSLRDLGRHARAMDLFARAASLAEREGAPPAPIEIELARLLATYAADRPAAVARVALVPQDSPVAHEARVLEATWRSEIGDRAGAARALGRLRALAEAMTASAANAAAVAASLLTAARLDERTLSDPSAAERDLALAVALDPNSAEAARELRRVARAAPPQPARAAAPAPAAQPAPEGTDAEPDESLVERLTDRLRAEPGDDEVAGRLAVLLERLGRDMELLALLSARLEEAAPARRAELASWRRAVLDRLAARAAAEGREDEAALYRSMAD